MKIRLIFAMLFAMFLPMVGLFAASAPTESGQETTYSKMAPSPVLVMVIVKVDKFVPFIRIVDSRRYLRQERYLLKTVSVTLWKAHLRNPIYESSGGC